MITFDAVTNKGDIETYTCRACYKPPYTRLGDYEKIIIYVDDEWLNKTWDHSKYWNLTFKDYRTYVKLLNRMGLNLSVKKEKHRSVFTVPLRENGIVGNKIVLNCVRYLCEADDPLLVVTFLKFAKQPGSNLFNKLLVSHFYTKYFDNVNHWFLPWQEFPLPMTLKKAREFFASNDNTDVGMLIPQCKGSYRSHTWERYEDEPSLADELTDMIDDNCAFKDIFAKYKELCNKTRYKSEYCTDYDSDLDDGWDDDYDEEPF